MTVTHWFESAAPNAAFVAMSAPDVRGKPTAAMCQKQSFRQARLAVAVCKMLSVGLVAEWLRVEERFDPEARILGHEQAAFDASLLDASELCQGRSQNSARPEGGARRVLLPWDFRRMTALTARDLRNLIGGRQGRLRMSVMGHNRTWESVG